MNSLPHGPRLHKICTDNPATGTYDCITLLFNIPISRAEVDLQQDSGVLCLPNG